MPETVTCQCGARVRLPEGGGGRSFRCPRCKTELVARPVPSIITGATAAIPTEGASCPICQTVVDETEDVLTCSECHQIHHRECWQEVGGCGTYGCSHAPALNKEAQAESEARSAWGDNKQ